MPELIGRDEELHALERFLAGRAGVLLLEGEAGIGKTSGATGMAQVSLTRHAVVYARGTARLRRGHVVRVHLERLRPIHAGRYRLTLRLRSHGSVVRIMRMVRIRRRA